jgi:Predicted amidohydrolase
MKISVAQIRPIKGDVNANIKTHKKIIELAVSYKADAIFFPELSLSGYEPALAKDLATSLNDTIFKDFDELSNKNSITIGLGMPIKTISGIQISMIIFQPGKSRQMYSKQQLHEDELPYFVSGEEQCILTVANKKIAPAICYESLQSNHSDNAYRLGAEIYVASVAKSKGGRDKALIHYPAVAKKFSIPVLMANSVGYCDNFESVGQSAVWTKRGELIAQLNRNSQGLLVFNTETEDVIQAVL